MNKTKDMPTYKVTDIRKDDKVELTNGTTVTISEVFDGKGDSFGFVTTGGMFVNGIHIVKFIERFRINQNLINQQEISDEAIDGLYEIHKLRRKVIQGMEKLSYDTAEVGSATHLHFCDLLRKCAKTVTALDFSLQKLWKFDQDINYHIWFELPHCSCPNMDNRERLGSGTGIINGDCPIHGNIDK